MDLATFITIISILVAVYTLLPRATKLTMSLKVVWGDWFVLVLFIIGMHYILFYGMFLRLELVPEMLINNYIVSKNELAYWMLFSFMVLTYIRFSLLPIPKSKMENLHKLVEELLGNETHHPQLISLVDKNLTRVHDICEKKFFLAKLRGLSVENKTDLRIIISQLRGGDDNSDYIHDFSFPILQKSNIPYFKSFIRRATGKCSESEESIYPLLKESNLVRINNTIKKILSYIAKLFPYSDRTVNIACDILSMTLVNTRFVKSISALKPYFSLKIFELDTSVSYSFSDRYLSALLNDKNSILYFELKNNQNLGRWNDYVIPERNRLLSYLFYDARNAEKFGVWKPIGETVLADLEKRKLEPKTDYYNYQLQESEGDGYWDSNVFIGIRFFDLMIRKAIIQNVNWHMWLYYYDYFVERMCGNYLDTYIDEDYIAEWPTRYSYFIYQIIDSLRDCIFMIENQNLNQSNLLIDGEVNGNPVKSSIIAMSSCFYSISHCEQIPERLKRYYIQMGLSLYLELKGSVKTEAYANYLFTVLLNGGKWDRVNHQYLGQLLIAFVEQDNVPYNHDDVITGMKMIVEKFLLKWNENILGQYVGVNRDGNVLIINGRNRRYTIIL